MSWYFGLWPQNTLGQSVCRIFYFWLVWLAKLNIGSPLLHCIRFTTNFPKFISNTVWINWIMYIFLLFRGVCLFVLIFNLVKMFCYNCAGSLENIISFPIAYETSQQDLFVMLCVILYHLYNLKNVKNTHGRTLLLLKTKNNTPPWVFFTFLKLDKCYQFAQSISSVLG